MNKLFYSLSVPSSACIVYELSLTDTPRRHFQTSLGRTNLLWRSSVHGILGTICLLGFAHMFNSSGCAFLLPSAPFQHQNVIFDPFLLVHGPEATIVSGK